MQNCLFFLTFWNKNPLCIVCERPGRLIIWTTNRPASGSLQRLMKSPEYLPKRSNFRFNWSRKNFSYIFALKNFQTYVCHSKQWPSVRKTNNPQFPVPKVPGEAPTPHAMIPYDVRGQKSKKTSILISSSFHNGHHHYQSNVLGFHDGQNRKVKQIKNIFNTAFIFMIFLIMTTFIIISKIIKINKTGFLLFCITINNPIHEKFILSN